MDLQWHLYIGILYSIHNSVNQRTNTGKVLLKGVVLVFKISLVKRMKSLKAL